ncbi:MAG: histidinol dehydrogenase [Bacteroidales bacterium]|nr:histidinol dehydrogenase [Bacteroidales bacterium]
MRIIENPPRTRWNELVRRGGVDYEGIRPRVESILEQVEKEGDAALPRLMLAIDGVTAPLEVSQEEVETACEQVDPKVREAIRTARAHIEAFHRAQLPREIRVETAPGVVCIQKPVPISRVGLYIPGGSAPLFSTVLMLAVPAALAGCRERILCTPCRKDGSIAPEVLFAARECGITRIFRLGGAQAVAAMAFGTETVPKVDKIFGPGNPYVTLAKQLVSGRNTAIDMPAGPSEVMVLADGSAPAAFAAADLLSQAEHGKDSTAVLVCTERDYADKVLQEIENQKRFLPRDTQVEGSLAHSFAVVLPDLQDLIDFAEAYAPEHLIVALENAAEAAEGITAAGSVFIGPWSPESAGDYASGTNHTLPTSGWARSCSGVNMDSFFRKMTLQEITREGLAGLAPTIVSMARAEGLDAHAQAVTLRMQAK